jgi:hypothetical protein
LDEGEELGRKKRYADAIARFKAADALQQRGLHDCWIALSYARLAYWSQARAFLDRCREREGSAPVSWFAALDREIAEEIKKAAYAAVTVSAEPADSVVRVLSFSPDERFQLPATLWLPPGQHVLSVEHGPGRARRSLELSRDERIAVHVELTPSRSPAKPKGAAAPVAQTSGGSGRGHWRGRVLEYALVGGGVVALGVGAVFHVTAAQARQRAMETGNDYDAEVSRLKRDRVVAVGMYVAGAAALGLGAALWLRADDKEAPPRLSLASDGRGFALAVEGAF